MKAKEKNKSIAQFNIILNEFNSDLLKYSKQIIEKPEKEFKDFFNRMPENDSLFVGAEFLNLYHHSREENLSDKLAWILSLSFIRKMELRQSICSELINSLLYQDEVNSDFLKKSKGNIKIEREKKLSTSRKITETIPRLDLFIQDLDQKIVLGIEVKAGDRGLLKSKDDFLCLKHEYQVKNQVQYLLILSESQLQDECREYKSASSPSEFKKIKSRELGGIILCTWEDVIFAIRSILKDPRLHHMHCNFLQMFISSLESEEKILGYDLEKIRKLYENEIKTLQDLALVKEYLKYRKSQEIEGNGK